MTSLRNLLLCSVLLAGCTSVEPRDDVDLSCSRTDAKPNSSDMAPAAPKCAAAAGLTGTNLLCVDFDRVTQLNDPALTGWKFDASTPCPGWQISSGSLQVQNFGSFMGNCGITLPPIDLKQADKQQYQRLTLALVHKVDMSDPDQQAQIFMDVDSPARLVHQMTGKPGFPTSLTTTTTVNKTDLPGALMSVYKFFLKASSLNVVGGRQGWQIQSIAVNGTP